MPPSKIIMTLNELEKRIYQNNKPVVMGILNITPDSFSDSGKYFKKDTAVEHALEMAENGADIIDIGGESTRPGAEPVSDEEELKRILPVIGEIVSKTNVPVSIDTYKSEIAEKALEAGAVIVNDISALRHSSDMAGIIAKHDAFVVLMHMLGEPKMMQKNPVYNNVVTEIYDFLDERCEFAVKHGIKNNRIIVDPGIGFGKTIEHNLEIIRNIDKFSELGYPVLVGVSRKSFIGKITGAPIEKRLLGTAAVTAYCLSKGISIHRVHDVKEICQVRDIIHAIRGNNGI